ncbi:MAG: flavocytochrome c [Peptoniphilaceae bacterium]|nr:flavocytochrome c [Peptoniphilaceae bacterium]
MKKKLTLFSLAMALVLTACGSQNNGGASTSSGAESFKGGTYKATAEGYNKSTPIEIAVTYADDKSIEKVEVVKQEETDAIGGAALEKLPQMLVDSQNVNMDGISGATFSSNAFFTAVKDTMKQAGVKEEDLKPAKSGTNDKKEYDVDVVVVGAGGAGLTAAIEAKSAGANVLLLEKEALSGGNTVKATGGMNAAKTPYQDANKFSEAEETAIRKQIATAKEKYPDLAELANTVEKQLDEYLANPQGYFDSVELFMLDTMVGGKGINNPELVKTLVDNSAATIEWLKENGMTLESVGSFGGASVKRIHRPVGEDGKTVAVGSYLVPKLTKLAKEKGVEILYSTPATELIQENGKVAGVKAGDITVHAKSVVLATGGFGADLERVVSYKKDLKGFVTTNAPGATGDGIDMAAKAGAATVDMDQIQIHPTVEQSTASLITEGVRGDGAILVNQEGVRFTNEVSTRDVVSAAEIAQPGGYAYLIFDQALADKSAPLSGYIKKGFTTAGETYEELAKTIDVDPATLTKTMETWNGYVEAKKDPDFDRTSFTEPLSKAPFYAIKLSPGIHHTMGGLVINTASQVLNESSEPISGLYAAGEVTGGVHGANRLGGNAVADILIFGRIAGQNAAKNAK